MKTKELVKEIFTQLKTNFYLPVVEHQVYDDTEQIIGNYYGKPLYRKMISIPVSELTDGENILQTGLSNLDYMAIDPAFSCTKTVVEGVVEYWQIPSDNGGTGNNLGAFATHRVWTRPSTGEISLYVGNLLRLRVQEILIAILYTKAADTITTKTPLDLSIENLTGSLYKDYSLGNQFTTEQAQMIAAGDFKYLINGGYWDVDGKKVRIVDNRNWYKGRGAAEFTKNHLVIMCDENILKADGSTRYMKDSDNTSGGYAGTKYRATYRAQAKKFYTDFFGTEHIASYRGLIATATANNRASSWAWNDCDVELPTENMMAGSPYWGNGAGNGHNGGSFYGQLALFQLAPEYIIARAVDGARESYWEQDVVSAAGFALVSGNGYFSLAGASETYLGCRPFALLI